MIRTSATAAAAPFAAHSRLARPLGYGAAALFAAQFVLLDATFRGAGAWLQRPRLLGDVASSLAIGLLVLVVVVRSRARVARAVAALVAGLVLVAQAVIFRYYHAPLDVQVAASALFAWHDVRQVVLRSAPGLVMATAAASALEYALLSFVRASLVVARPREGAPGRLPPLPYALAFASLAGLFGAGPQNATPEVRAVHAMRALFERRAPAAAAVVSLPPLHVEKTVPSVLFVLTESVRAVDYRPAGDRATAPETARVTPDRVELAQMRAVSSYTAVSLSALLTARSQEGARDAIVRSPTLFDIARATRDAKGIRPIVAYYSAQSETVFEAKEMRAAVDHFVTVETFRGRDVEDDADYAELPLDREIVDRFVRDLGGMSGAGAAPTVAMLHLVGTHAPYFLDPARAPFQPFDHVVTWSRMPKLHAAYEDAIYEQDRTVARAVSAFVEQARREGRPWLVVFTSDHGESFGENGAIHHGQNLMDEQVHVPAWIAAGGGALSAPQSRALADHASRFVTHLDVLPTVLDAMGLWDNFALRAHRDVMPGRSLLRPHEERAPIPVTNCTGMFPCPLNTWGLYDGDRKLVARLWDPGWSCFALGAPEGERALGPDDARCERLRALSRRTFPLLPNGQPNR